MKYIILLFLFIPFQSSVTLAQSNAGFGIKAGLNVASVRGEAANSLRDLLDFTDGRITSSDRTGIYAGVSANIPISSEFSVEPGIYYTQKGYQLNGELGIKGLEFLGANAKATLQSDYISLPVLLKANIAGLQIFAGPQVSLLSSAKLRTTAGLLGFNILNKSFDASDQLNKWEAGLTGGIGYQFSNGLNISAAYDHGLSRIDADQNFSAYNKAFKVGIGFNF
jgi:hypothetical protein